MSARSLCCLSWYRDDASSDTTLRSRHVSLSAAVCVDAEEINTGRSRVELKHRSSDISAQHGISPFPTYNSARIAITHVIFNSQQTLYDVITTPPQHIHIATTANTAMSHPMIVANATCRRSIPRLMSSLTAGPSFPAPASSHVPYAADPPSCPPSSSSWRCSSGCHSGRGSREAD